MSTLNVSAPIPRFWPDGANSRIIVTTDTDDIPYNKGFLVDVDGVLSCRLRRESAVADLTVLAGVHYPYDIAEVDITGSTSVTTVTVFQNY